MYLTHVIQIYTVIKFNINGARVAKGICDSEDHVTPYTTISLITGEGQITGITGGKAIVSSRILFTIFYSITVRTIVYTGIVASYTLTTLTGVYQSAVKVIIAGCGVVHIRASAVTIAGVIRAHIGVITAVGRARADSTAAGVGVGTGVTVIAGFIIIGVYTGPRTVALIIRTHIPVIGTDRA